MRWLVALSLRNRIVVVALGVLLVVCQEDKPFNVVVDGVDGDDLTFAIALATPVLN